MLVWSNPLEIVENLEVGHTGEIVGICGDVWLKNALFCFELDKSEILSNSFQM